MKFKPSNDKLELDNIRFKLGSRPGWPWFGWPILNSFVTFCSDLSFLWLLRPKLIIAGPGELWPFYWELCPPTPTAASQLLYVCHSIRSDWSISVTCFIVSSVLPFIRSSAAYVLLPLFSSPFLFLFLHLFNLSNTLSNLSSLSFKFVVNNRFPTANSLSFLNRLYKKKTQGDHYIWLRCIITPDKGRKSFG